MKCFSTGDARMRHVVHLDEVPFEKIQSGKKTIELRLYDEKRQKINIGDIIIFENRSQPKVSLLVRVINIYHSENFDNLYKSLPLQKCGYSANEVKTASPDDMLKYYSEEEQQRYGVVGIEIEICET